ncbi:hypothetical protein L2E82_43342 [Cichorium intybus]|uniref:Uncharacterized protein n=1 Tax=Cichorium intybus TaxID=13427 RepID=A0ACB8ZN31_CICIN|nr:hypothetical protein L2E82_43342 [Cichorium intybus]
MATEQETNVPSLPPYPQLIFEAIDALKQKEGSNKSSILNYIESTYGNLPSGGTNLLTENLKNLKESGELVLLRNNYMRPDPNSPLKRGRGRPSKPKDPATLEKDPAAQSGSEVKRGRGRPKKDPNAPPSAKKVKVPAASTPSSKTGSGRPRGRPRKVQPELTSVEVN